MVNNHKYYASLYAEILKLKPIKKAMQDPLFNLTQEQPIDLGLLLGPAQQGGVDSGATDSAGDFSSSSENIESLSDESLSEMEGIVEELKEEAPTSSNTMSERIKQVEEEYNTKPIAISGKLRERLLTMRTKLNITSARSN